jgi:LmbE family N-acetylglucosaminyl deacetylase
MKKSVFLLLCFCLASSLSRAHVPPRPLDAASLKLELEKLTVVGTALYLGAHPDDENTAVLAYLSRGRLLRTAYLSLTRGDGGQNLIGPEQGALLGVIRTQELLAARKIDGAEQFFSRAVDFGFSKTPEESLKLWGREKILADVVWVIRNFRPDVVVSRFTSAGGGHGHHTASAILAEEAFHAAADPTRFPEQLQWVQPWKATRLAWNMYSWGDQSGADRTGALSADIGAFNPLLGRSYRELSGESRSMHKSQGMGAPEGRGSLLNHFQVLAGQPAAQDLLEGVDTSWNRIPGGGPVGDLLRKAVSDFRVDQPAATVPLLLEAYALMQKLEPHPLVLSKKTETLEAIRLCSGLWLEAICTLPYGIPGQKVDIAMALLNRSDIPFHARSARVEPAGQVLDLEQMLADNEPLAGKLSVQLPASGNYSQPYWLARPDGEFAYRVDDQRLIGLAESPPAFTVDFVLSVNGQELPFRVPVLHRWVDPVEGERYRLFVVAPEVSVSLKEPVLVFDGQRTKSLSISVRNQGEAASGTLHLMLPDGWSATPDSIPFEMDRRGQTMTGQFLISAEAGAKSGLARGVARVNGKEIACSAVDVSYPHFPPQMVLEPAEARVLNLDLRKSGQKVGYVMGSGDHVPQALRQIGYEVTLLTDEELATGELSGYDAVMVGIRAYNTRARLEEAQPRLLEYVKRGGTLVVQYNTSQDLVVTNLGPYPLSLSRNRVSVEEAPIRITAPDHPLLLAPNRIGAADFDGWVQERGLYFPGQWDPRYETMLSTNDPGEAPLNGGILLARFGKGVYIHTSYAWFRQLPAGVPGAYRLLANLVSAGANNEK